ncbi:MAG: SRPBCC family protein [Caulobacteraceae bacterium]|nr:SRPBCC family protein [Caulobacteraceae bacterium]
MFDDTDAKPINDRELVLERIIEAPAETLYRCWTEPELMKQWFVPKPWTIARVDQDVRPGGRSLVVMKDPEGNEYPNPGTYLEVVPGRKLVFTDAFTEGWVPTDKAFMVAIVTFEDLGNGKTRYVARARHWTDEDVKQHVEMGFHEGWGQCADQLAELARTF